MEQKRRPFRFRIPWKSEPSVSPSAAESSSRRPKKKPKSPFRPPGIAPVQPQPHTTQSPSRSIAHATTGPSSSTPQKLETDTGNSKTQWEEQSKSLQSEENLKVGKAEETVSGRQQMTKPPLSRACRGEKKQSEASETVERQMMFSTSNPSGKDIKVSSSTNPKISNVSCISPQKPLLPNARKAPSQKEIKEDVSNCDHKLAVGRLTQPMDENPFSVTTLAGDNRGATMNIGSRSGKKETLIPIYRAYKKNPEQRTEVSAEGDESSEEESGNSVENEIGNAYVNSNIQSLNNSLMCQSSINDRDPGVHLTLPQKHAEIVKRDDKRGPEIRKPEINVNRNDGLRIRRRCLRGLFAEPSDSDPDNPNKSQLHGCKYKCGDV